MNEERVNHPKHYNAHPSGVECIDVIENFMGNLANAVKYLWRAGHKGDRREDLQKARWYVEREMERSIRFYPDMPLDDQERVLLLVERFCASEPNKNIRDAVACLSLEAVQSEGATHELRKALMLIDAELAVSA